MTDKQLRNIGAFALGYLTGKILLWLAFGAYLWMTGRA